MIKIYPSSIGKMQGSSIIGYNQSCLRYQILNPKPDRVEIDKIYQLAGLIGELRAAAELGNELQYEVPVQYDIGDNVVISGRIDAEDTINQIIHEFKTTVSKTKYYKYIANNTEIFPPHEYIGQILTYMAIRQYRTGIIHMSYIHFDNTTTALQFETRKFHIVINDQQQIVIDDHVYGLFSESMYYYAAVKNAHLKPDLPPKIISESACENCPAKNICAQNPKDKSEFYRLVNELGFVSPLTNPTHPKILTHNVRRSK